MKKLRLALSTLAVCTASMSMAQNVGIGTPTPTEKIHVVGGARITSLSGVGNRLVQSNATGVLSNIAGGANGQILTVVGGNFVFQDPQADNGLYYNTAVDRIRLGGPLVEATTITQGTNQMTFNLNSTGDFNVQDNGITHFQVRDNGLSYFGDDTYWNDGTVTGTTIARLYDSGNDGIFQVYRNGALQHNINSVGTTVFNEQGISYDLKMEGNNDQYTFYLDGSTDRVGVGLNLPSRKLSAFDNVTNTDRGAVYGDISNSAQWGYGVEGFGGYSGTYGECDATMRIGGGAFFIGAYGRCDGNGSGLGISLGARGDAFDGQDAYGVYGQAFGATGTNYAGYFNGDVFATGAYLPSDKRLKKDIEDLGKDRTALDMINQLSPKSYFYTTEGFEGLISLPTRKSYGFLAQDFAETFPELTKQVNLVAMSNDGKSNTNSEYYTAINYIGLIPILTQGMKEQQEIIDVQNERINRLEREIEEIKKLISK